MTIAITVLSSTVVAAAVAGIVSLVTWRLEGRRADTQRRRNVYAKAFAAYKEYLEYPYRIRRRSPESPDQRAELARALGLLQRDLAYYEAWIETESEEVGERYRRMMAEMRKVAGKAMSDAWNRPGATRDADMNTEVVDTAGLGPAERAYLESVRKHLSWARWFWRRAASWIGC